MNEFQSDRGLQVERTELGWRRTGLAAAGPTGAFLRLRIDELDAAAAVTIALCGAVVLAILVVVLPVAQQTGRADLGAHHGAGGGDRLRPACRGCAGVTWHTRASWRTSATSSRSSPTPAAGAAYPAVEVELGMVVEDRASGYCGDSCAGRRRRSRCGTAQPAPAPLRLEGRRVPARRATGDAAAPGRRTRGGR